MSGNEHGQGSTDIHRPFTKAELIEQLAEIDSDIALLLSHTGTAIQSLAQPITGPKSPNNQDSVYHAGTTTTATNADTTIANLDAEERLATFKSSMNAFMATLHSVDVHLKRQIWGLEEAGIISLKSSRDAAAADSGGPAGAGSSAAGAGGAAAAATGGSADAAGSAVKTSLEPDAVGKIGGLDVGWLNARSNKVERDMEAELWTGMRKHLEEIAAGRIQVGNELFGPERSNQPTAEGEGRDQSMESW